MAEVKKSKQIISGDAVYDATIRGINKINGPVSATLGSTGGNVSIERNWGAPLVVHDGVTVAQHVVLSNPFENQAAQLVIQAAAKTNAEAGDGTTTTTILTTSITTQAIRAIRNGTNATFIRRGINKGVSAVITALEQMAKPVETLEEMIQVATISSGDPDMGKLIAETIQKAGGAQATVSIQDGQSSDIQVEYKEGLEFSSGLISPYMMNNAEGSEAFFDFEGSGDNVVYPAVVVVNETVDVPKLKKIADTVWVSNNKTPLLIIADNFEADAIATMVVTKLQGGRKIAAVKSPEFGEHRLNVLMDIAAATGATLMGGHGQGVPVDDFTLEHVGHTRQVISTRDNTILVGGQGDDIALASRIQGIRDSLAKAADPGLRDKAELRLSRLEGSVAVISVGANSAAEQREVKERVIDAVNATRAAAAEGIVPGGGVALLQASTALIGIPCEPGEEVGVGLLKEALEAPLHKLVSNAGGKLKPDFVIGMLRSGVLPNTAGYNAESDLISENMLSVGIIDPVKVTKSALRNAASTAIILMTTNHMIAYDRVELSKEDTQGDLEAPGIGAWEN